MSKETFRAAIMGMTDEVFDFHNRFGIHQLAWDDEKIMNLRHRLLSEEVGEVAKAINHDEVGGAVEELGDVLFIALGSILQMGVDAELATEAVTSKSSKKTTHTHRLDQDTGKVLRFYPVKGETTP